MDIAKMVTRLVSVRGFIVLFVILCALSPTIGGFAQTDPGEQLQAYNLELRSRRDRGEITWLQWRKLVHERANQLSQPTPSTEEYYTYTEYIASEVDAGRTSKEQGEYLIAQARNKATAQQQQQQQQMIQQFSAGECQRALSETQYWCQGPGTRIPGMSGYNCADAQRRIGQFCR